jgi:integrase
VAHKIRFYGATELYDAGVDPEQIRRVMGHTTLAMTEHYNRTNGKIIVDKEIWNKIFGSKKPDGD